MKARRFDFYPDDWIAGTVSLSNADRGLYITVCAMIWSHGGPIEIGELFSSCTDHATALKNQLNRLVARGKLSVKGSQIINKRAVNELQKARKRVVNASQNGRKGGLQTSKNNRLAAAGLQRETESSLHLPSPSPSPSPSQFKKEERTPPTPRKRGASSLDGFEDWWEGYPHKVDKGRARKAWPAAIAKTSLGELIIGVQRYIAAKPPALNWCNPQNWLTGERWLDDPGSAPQNQSPVTTLYEGALRAADKLDREERDRRVDSAAVVPLLDCGRSR